MSSDLERFLQQAAERLAQKTNPNARSNRLSPSQSNPPRMPGASQGGTAQAGGASRPFGSRPPLAEVVEAEVLEDEARKRTLRLEGSDPLSTIDTRPQLGQSIREGDERMGSHVHQVFDHELTQLRAASPTLAQSGQVKQTNQSTEVSTRNKAPHPLLSTLNDPETLRTAFILGEIFRRKF